MSHHERLRPSQTRRLTGPRVLELRVHRDARGSFCELWRETTGQAEDLPRFVQDNAVVSRRGVVRGLHLQHPRAQAKLVSVALGEVFDVVVDVRVGSPTFGEWAAFTLSAENGHQLYVPPGFAHGYQAVSDTAVVTYKCSDYYAPECELCVHWADPRIAIAWPIADAVIAPRDAAAPALRDIDAERLPPFAP